jgi:AcrR family transcriptional regulator
MQVKKDSVFDSVFAVARKEFLEKGYKNTNMRTIARKAGVVLSNIYNYFDNKDELFREVLAPVIAALDKLMDKHNSEANLHVNVFTSQEYLKEQTQVYVEFIHEYRDELNILLFKSHGSSLENYKEEYIARQTRIGLEYLRLMKERYPHAHIDLSDFFIHTMGSWWISILGELVMHRLERIDLERFVSEYIEYAAAGWKRVLHI